MSSKVALITGAAKRLGAATATKLHQQGYRLVIHYHHSHDTALALADRLNSQTPDSVKLVQADIRNPTEIKALAQQAQEAFGRLDLLINNASSFYPTELGSITEADWQDLVGTNMQAPLFLSQACLTALKRHRGCIINMCDIHAEKPLKGHTLYCMAKAALVMMTQSLARELAPEIRVNGIAPGAILWPETPLSEGDKENVLHQVPMQRLGTPEDIAETIYFLADQAPYITGQILAVDGGRSLGGANKA